MTSLDTATKIRRSVAMHISQKPVPIELRFSTPHETRMSDGPLMANYSANSIVECLATGFATEDNDTNEVLSSRTILNIGQKDSLPLKRGHQCAGSAFRP